MAKKIELLHTTYDENGNIESQEVVHPLTSPDCIIMENGKTLDEVMGDGIATPTLTHEGTSFKVGVGDSNIEVVDGDVAGMTLKGQSYQNILPKPTTLIMETDEKEFKINDKIDSNIIIDDNIAEIATIKGKTIVNAVQEESVSEYTVLGEDLSGQSIVHVKETLTLEGQTLVNHVPKFEKIMPIGTGSHRTVYSGIPSKPLKPNTSYLFINHSNVGYKLNVSIKGETTSEKLAISNLITSMHKFTTPDNTEDFTRIMVYLMSDNESELTYNTFMIIEYQEGMENWDIPYFEGTKTFESNIKGVTLQGQTLVNTIQEPCKDDYVVLGVDDSIEISAETGGCGTIENTVQGGINGAILKGQTLVNLISGGREFTIQGGTNKGFALTYSQTTTYTLLFKVNKNNSSNKLLMQEYNGESWLRNVQIDLVSGENKAVITPTNSVTQIVFVNSATDELVIGDMMLLSGNYNNHEIPYFTGMTSVEMPILTTTGKNLFNGKLEAGFIDIDTGVHNNSGDKNIKSVDFIEMQSNYITISKKVTTQWDLWILEYDINKEFIKPNNYKGLGCAELIKSIELMPSTRYIKFYTVTSGENPKPEDGLMIVNGQHSTLTYEPYKSSTVTMNNILLIDGGYTNGYLDDRSTLITTTVDFHTNDFTPIKPNTELVTNASTLYYYDENKNWIGRAKTLGYTTPSNARYIKAQWGVEYTINDLWVRENVVLRGFGDFKDELDLTTGKLTQRIGEALLDGSEDENWYMDMHLNDDTKLNMTFKVDLNNIINYDFATTGMLCDRFTQVTGSSLWLDDVQGVGSSNGDGIKIGIPKSNLTTQDVNGFRYWLSQNPVTVQYQLETESVKTVDLTVIDQDNNTMPHIQTQPTVTHITTSSDYLIPTVTIDNNLAYETIIKPSTLYTIRFKHDTVNVDNPLTVDLGGAVQEVTSTEFTITTPSTLTHNQLVFSGKNNVVSEVQVIEGDVTNIEYPFFEGMNDVKFSDGKFIARNCPFIFGKGGRI